MIFAELETMIASKKNRTSDYSYTKKLLSEDFLVERKVNEEAYEVVEASFKKDRTQLIFELSDLFYHTLVLMGKYEIGLDDINQELQRRKKNENC